MSSGLPAFLHLGATPVQTPTHPRAEEQAGEAPTLMHSPYLRGPGRLKAARKPREGRKRCQSQAALVRSLALNKTILERLAFPPCFFVFCFCFCFQGPFDVYIQAEKVICFIVVKHT